MHHRTFPQFSVQSILNKSFGREFPHFFFQKFYITWWRYDRAKSVFTIKSKMILKMSNKLIAVVPLSSRKTLSREVLSLIAKLSQVRTGSKGCQAVSSTHLIRTPKIKLSAQKQDFSMFNSGKKRNQSALRWANFPFLTQATQTMWAFVVPNSAI